jgi:hypothetical protein
LVRKESPTFLTLVHPQGFQSLIASLRAVHRFRKQIGSTTASGENAQIAREVLIDTVDSSGVDIGAIVTLLESFSGDVANLDGMFAQLVTACDAKP